MLGLGKQLFFRKGHSGEQVDAKSPCRSLRSMPCVRFWLIRRQLRPPVQSDEPDGQKGKRPSALTRSLPDPNPEMTAFLLEAVMTHCSCGATVLKIVRAEEHGLGCSALRRSGIDRNTRALINLPRLHHEVPGSTTRTSYVRRDESPDPRAFLHGLVDFSPIAMMNSLGTPMAVEKYGSSSSKRRTARSVLQHPTCSKTEKVRRQWNEA